MEMKKCSASKRQRVVENILKRAKDPMRPQEIKSRFNRWCDKHGYELSLIHISILYLKNNLCKTLNFSRFKAFFDFNFVWNPFNSIQTN